MKYLIGLSVFTLLIITGAYFWLFSDDQLQTEQEKMEKAVAQLKTQSDSQDSAVALNGFGTMNDLLGREENLECQITTIENTVTDEGTFFVADQKIRGDFITQSPDMSSDSVSSIIVTSDTMYIWTEIEGELYGVKTQTNATQQADIQTQEPVSLDERVKYSCKKWARVDHSIFIPPSDVMFQDASRVIQGGMEYGTVYEEGEMPY